jgi:NADH-quinone oxidoreductase subunit C
MTEPDNVDANVNGRSTQDESATTGRIVGHGLFGVGGSGDTSGFGGLVRRTGVPAVSGRPVGVDEFDEVLDGLEDALATRAPQDEDGGDVQKAFLSFDEAIERIVVDRGELTLHIRPAAIADVCRALRDDEGLRYELCSSVSGVDYPAQERRLHAVYHLTSMTYRRRLRLECAVTAEDPHLPSVTSVYPTADWQERETYDMFGIIFDGHPNLTRILMPDDWEGYPQRKDYPLGGVPVEYKGAEIPPPDQRRSYR